MKLERMAPAQNNGAGESIEPATVWPDPLGEAAYHGLPGDIVRTIAPQSEADPAALLVTTLVMYGSAVGPSPHLIVEDDRHPARLYGLIVGNTSKARKGTSRGRIARIYREAQIDLPKPWMRHGLVSGEGLIWHVRDETYVKKRGKTHVEPGVTDKRLLVCESEFAGILQVAKRQGQTLSPVLRSAWDSGDLETLAKQVPAVATGAHISLLGHITATELHRHLDTTELANGLINRVLLVCARRSKELPFGGEIDEEAMAALATRLHDAWEEGRRVERMEWTPGAAALWEDVYSDLSAPRPGLYGAATARGEAQVLRIAMTYALIDGYRVICEEHLRAALELWRYCRDSARAIFGEATGSPIADRILGAIRKADEGMTRTQIHRALSGKASRVQLDDALSLLQEHRLARMHVAADGDGARPLARWFAT